MLRPETFRSVGFRFAVLHTTVFVACVLLIGLVSWTTVSGTLLRQSSQRVMSEMEALSIEFDREGLNELRLAVEAKLGDRHRRLRYALIDGSSGVLVGDQGLGRFAGPDKGADDEVRVSRYDDGEGDTILVGQRAIGSSRLVVADDLEGIEDIEAVLTRALTVATLLAVLFGLLSGALLARSLLSKVEHVTRTAEAIIGGDLSRRIPSAGSGDEFDRLSRTLNVMLERISDLVDNVRQVSSDIAHDLRTPLSRLRQKLERTRSAPRSLSGYEAAIDGALVEVDGLLSTFTALLSIAQIEAGARRSGFRTTSLSDAVRTVVEAYQPAVEDHGDDLVVSVDDDIDVSGDRDLLQQVFANLIENALTHAPRGSRIEVRARLLDGTPVVEICDDGPGIPAHERTKVFRRFYRLERSRTTSGNGLGLSLVAAILNLHSARIELHDNRPGLRVTVVFGHVAHEVVRKPAGTDDP